MSWLTGWGRGGQGCLPSCLPAEALAEAGIDLDLDLPSPFLCTCAYVNLANQHISGLALMLSGSDQPGLLLAVIPTSSRPRPSRLCDSLASFHRTLVCGFMLACRRTTSVRSHGSKHALMHNNLFKSRGHCSSRIGQYVHSIILII